MQRKRKRKTVANIFKGKLDGVTIDDISKEIDYSISNLKERKEKVEQILDNTKFFEEYFSDYFDTKVGSNDGLASESNICKTLEAMGTYLLNSVDEREKRKKEEVENELKYKFHANPIHFKAEINKEKNLEELNVSGQNNGEEYVLHFLETEKKNTKKPKTQFINGKDLKRDDDLGQILRDYNDFYVNISNRLKQLDIDIKANESNPDKGKRYLLTNTKGTLRKDMVDVKNILLGVFGYNISSSNEGGHYDFQEDELRNNKVVREILRAFNKKEKMPIDSDMFHIYLDIENAIDKGKKTNNFTHNELLIIEDVMNGLRDCDIATSHGWTRPYVNQQLRRTVNKIIKML